MAIIAIDMKGSDFGCEELAKSVKQYLSESTEKILAFADKTRHEC